MQIKDNIKFFFKTSTTIKIKICREEVYAESSLVD